MYESHLKTKHPQVEWRVVGAALALMVIGALSIYSATWPGESAHHVAFYRQRVVTQLLYYGVGLGLGVALCLIDYHVFSRWSLVGYWAAILCLVAVLVPFIGKKVYGARRWIDLGVFQFQPSEFAKLAFIFAQANFLSRPLEELRQPWVFMKAIGLTVLPFLLILKEPDLGSALVLLPVSLAMIYVAGAPPKYLVRLVAGTGLVVGLILVDILFMPPKWQIKLADYQRHRLLVYFGRDFAPKGAPPEEKRRARELEREKSYNVEQALISVGSGGFVGKGWKQGTQNALGYLPRGVAHNDFIFSVIAEERGFVGSLIVLGLYATVLFTGIQIAGQARDRLGRLLATGVVALLFSHVFINVGMNIRLMPVTGIPLPLLSHGGSSVVCSLVAMAVLQNVYLYRRHY
ncbi:MAG: rod shape-determining protein RodA [Verrucomicrobia bacterium]|nr:rod shape-determining protein RodA [Verrucomicrobiota bacterium]